MLKKLAGLLGAGTLVVVLALPTEAAPPTGLASYDAGATSAALVLDAPVLELTLAAADTGAGVSSTPAALAIGSPLLIEGIFEEQAEASLPGGEPTAEVCAIGNELDLPDPLDFADPNIACVTANASLADNSPTSDATSDELELSVGGAGLSNQILTPLLEPVITPIIEGLGDLGDLITIQDVVDQVVASLVDPAGTTATITLAPNLSETSATAESGVLAHALSQGATIAVLPNLPAGPLVSITVAQSEAQVVRDATSGAATPTVTPAVIDIEWNTVDIPPITILTDTPLETEIPAVTQQIEDAINDLINQLATASPFTCSGDNPLADVVCFEAASGETFDSLTAAEAEAAGFPFGDGTALARASALHVQVLAAAEGGITLDLAQAVAAANASPVQVTTTTAAPTTTTIPLLARTGGGGTSVTWLAVVAAAGLGGLVLVRRASALR